MAKIAGVKLADMKRPKESLSPKNVGSISPDPYSYGHRISLDQDALDKLGVTETPKVGDVFHILGQAHVHSVDSHEMTGGKPNLSVGLQFKKMGIHSKGTPKKGGALEAVSKGIKEADES